MARPGPAGPPPAPIAQRLTIRYAKRGRMRFASHRDIARAIERGVRKAGLPVAYSAGYSPHPKISYPGGAPTGTASEAEYLELSLTRTCEPGDVGRRLSAGLPEGIDVIEVLETEGGFVGARLEASAWEVTLPGVEPAAAAAAVEVFLAAPRVEVERLTSKGLRRLDARAAVVVLSVDRRAGSDAVVGCAILRMIVRQMTPAVRPDDILTALRQSSALVPTSPALATRLWQGPLDGMAAAETGMILAADAAGHAMPGSPPVAWPLSAAAGSRQVHRTDKAPCLQAGSADPAPAGQVRANEQLPRDARDRLAGSCAREPDGRDCPDARNRAAKRTT